MLSRLLVLAAAVLLHCVSIAVAMEHVTVQRDGQTIEVSGEIQIEAQDGGLLLMGRDGVLWALQPDEIKARSEDDAPFERLDRAAVKKKLLKELPSGFQIYETANYVVAYNTSRAYAMWVASLYERLHRGFYNYWKKRGLDLHEPELPLVAVVFEDQTAYAKHSEPELGDAASSIVGYYSLRSNQVITYDLTGRGEFRTARRPSTSAIINKVLADPQAVPTVATIIHEATHQLAYNSGLQRRYADNPLWVSEGLAIYFETPDLKSSRGWRSIGSVNEVRLSKLRRDIGNYTVANFVQMLTDDELLRNPDTAISGYAQAWGWCHFLAKRYSKEYAAYLTELSKGEPMTYGDADDRVALFRKHFGDDLEKLHAQFVRYVASLR